MPRPLQDFKGGYITIRPSPGQHGEPGIIHFAPSVQISSLRGDSESAVQRGRGRSTPEDPKDKS